MKFKTIFIIFNIIVSFSFIFMFVLPLFILGLDYASLFWERNWPLALAFAAVLAALNAFFAMNWRVFSLLERENWPELCELLETKVMVKGRLAAHLVRLLVNTYLVRSDLESIGKLEAFVAERKPALLRRFAVLFGVPHVLKGDAADCAAYFGRFEGRKGIAQPEWLEWDKAYALLIAKREGEASAAFGALAAKARDPVVKALSAYLYANSSRDAANAEEWRASMAKRYSPAAWERELERAKTEAQAVILSKLLDDATAWLYPEASK
jgi:hypothetical protein